MQIFIQGSDSFNKDFASHEEWLESDCNATAGKPFSVGHKFQSHTEKVSFTIGSFAGNPDQCVTMIGNSHAKKVVLWINC